MGTLTGLAINIVYSLPSYLGISLTFALSIVWSIASFKGWANLTGIKRFLVGFHVYGALPNIVLASLIFSPPQNMFDIFGIAPHLVLILLGSLGMGVGFSLSVPLMKKTEKQTSFNSWKYFMEYLSGLLYGVTSILSLSQFEDHILNIHIMIIRDMEILDYIFALFIFALIPTLSLFLAYRYHTDPRRVKGNDPKLLWSSSKRKIISASTITLGSVMAALVLLTLNIIALQIPFAILLLFYIFSGRIAMDTKAGSYKTDLVVDCSIGLLVTVLLLFI